MDNYIVPKFAIDDLANRCQDAIEYVEEEDLGSDLVDLFEELRDAAADLTTRSSWENRNEGNRVAIHIERGPRPEGLHHMSAIDITGFTVSFDGIQVFKYIGNDVHYALPRLSITPVHTDHGCDKIQLTFGGGFWAVIDNTFNAGKPVITYGEGTPEHEEWKRARVIADAERQALADVQAEDEQMIDELDPEDAEDAPHDENFYDKADRLYQAYKEGD